MHQQWGRQVSNNRSHVTLQRKKTKRKENLKNKNKEKKKNSNYGNWVLLFNVKRMSQVIESRAKKLT
jgi:hypothetical protein